MIVFTIIETIMYYICLCITLHYISNFAIKHKVILIIFPLLFSVSILLSYIVTKDSNNLFSFFLIILFSMSPRLIYKNSKLSTIIIVFLLLYATDIIFTSTITFVFGQSESTLFKTLLSFMINILFTVALIIFIKLKHLNIQQILNLVSKKVKVITFLSLITSAFILTIIAESPNFTNINKWDIVFKITISIFIIMVGIAFPILNINSYTKNYYKRQSDNLENQFQTQAEYYSSLAKSNFELRQFRHDYNNMKIGISELIKEGKNEDALNMLDYCDNQLYLAMDICKFDSGNNIADALLCDKQRKANKSNTTIIFNGAITNKINPTDLCVILGNALDNAIEACENINYPEIKVIKINCNCNGGFMFLNISNPVHKNISIHKDFIPTSKKNKSSHGFGLTSIKRAISKYDGNLSLTCINKEFTISIDLCLL